MSRMKRSRLNIRNILAPLLLNSFDKSRSQYSASNRLRTPRLPWPPVCKRQNACFRSLASLCSACIIWERFKRGVLWGKHSPFFIKVWNHVHEISAKHIIHSEDCWSKSCFHGSDEMDHFRMTESVSSAHLFALQTLHICVGKNRLYVPVYMQFTIFNETR